MQKVVLQLLYSFFLRWFLRMIVGVKFREATFLRGESQFIIVANHNSHLDTMCLLASVPRSILHQVKPVAAADYFGRTPLQRKLSAFFINALLIPRKRNQENPAEDPVHIMLQAIDAGFSLILFPEGTRGEAGKQQPLKPGIGLVLSQRPYLKYIPAYLTGMGKIMPKGDNLIVPFNSTLTYGVPTGVSTTNVDEILAQITGDLLTLKIQQTTTPNAG